MKSYAHILSFMMILLFGVNSVHAAITIERVNSTTVGLYEKFEVVYNLDDYTYDNPYDPEQIDVTSVFTSPSGKVWHLFGFFDDYHGVSEWKVRFSPNETGEWSYVIFAKDANHSDQSDVHTFTAVESEFHGWIRLSEENPHYMQYDDGRSYFGVGMYTPWRNSVNTFDTLKKFGGNAFAIWNINYGGMVNGYGLIEEELGRYNQTKCGKIDTLLIVAEERDMNIMYCFWPHDLFSNTVWAHQWHLNPYRFICDVKDVYSDELCWEYQKKQYRYLIARFSYSRALGIWEIMNEINGTDGWAAGRHDEAKEWVHKVHTYFKENDPYQHLTTASRSGGYGEYWPDMYGLIDLPNLHVYESQGWPTPYIGNVLRSSMQNYAFAAARFWNAFSQPGIFGEAGADLVTVDLYSPDYTAMYHNAIWASLTNGLASTPYWWTFTDPIRDVERTQMAHLGKFVADINFIKESKEHFEITTNDFDLFGMKGDSTAFGWIRRTNGATISAQQFDLDAVLHPDIPVYAVSYFNTWTGEKLETHIRPHVNSKLRDWVPELTGAFADVAFKIAPAQGGDIPVRIELSSDARTILNIDSLSLAISCYLFDEADRFCPDANATITFTLDGPGELVGATQVSLRNGAASINYRPSDEPGTAKIIATAAGLTPDTLSIRVKDRVILDDFESYNTDADLQSTWSLNSGHAEITLASVESPEKSRAMQLDYAIGAEYTYTVVIERAIDHSFKGGNYLTFWIISDGSNRDMEIRIYDVNRKYWTYTFALSANAGPMTIPLAAFEARDDDVPFDLSILSAMRLTIRKGEGEYGVGTLHFDDFKFPAEAPLDIEKSNDHQLPRDFELGQNYPNPFNLSTFITFHLPRRAHAEISVFNLNGQRVETLLDKLLDAGEYTVQWDTPVTLSSGLYFYQLHADEFTAIKKCLLAK